MGNVHAQPMKLSNLEIDSNKDWKGKEITNLNATITNGDIEKIGTNLKNDIILLSLIFK